MEPTDELLYLSCLPRSRPTDQETLLSLLSKIDDWDHFLKKAIFHRLQPRLYSFLKRQNAVSSLSPEIWRKIESVYFESQAYVMAHEAELARLLPRFNRAGIEVLLLKGAALLQTVYSRNPVRFLVDLDLLVHEEDFSRAEILLEESGYQTKPIRSHLPSAWHDRELGPRLHRGTSTWIHPQRDVKMDLHEKAFEELSFFELERDWLWREARPILVNEHRAFLPSPTNLFMHLLLHLVKHARMWENSLGWYLDLDECLRYFGNEIDDRLCLQILQKNHGAGKAYEILAFLNTYFSSPLPHRFKSFLEEKNIKPPSLESVFAVPKNSEVAASSRPDWSDRGEVFLFYWNRMSGLRKKMGFLWRWIFPDRRYLETKYPFGNLFEKLSAYARHFLATARKGVGFLPYLFGSQRTCPNRKNGYTLLNEKKYSHS